MSRVIFGFHNRAAEGKGLLLASNEKMLEIMLNNLQSAAQVPSTKNYPV